MSIGPLRRSIGALGLLALAPLAAMLVSGTLAPVDAAQRALLTLIGLLVLGRVATWGVDGLASAIERERGSDEDRRQEHTAPAPAPAPAAAPADATPVDAGAR